MRQLAKRPCLDEIQAAPGGRALPPMENIPEILQRLNDAVVWGFLENRVISEIES